MTWTIGDVVVPKTAYEDYESIRRNGGKVSVMVCDYWHDDYELPYVCLNCHGTGKIIIEVITGGPYDVPTNTNPGELARAKKPIETTTFIKGKWYKRVLNSYICTACNETGRRPVDVKVIQEQIREPVATNEVVL